VSNTSSARNDRSNSPVGCESFTQREPILDEGDIKKEMLCLIKKRKLPRGPAWPGGFEKGGQGEIDPRALAAKGRFLLQSAERRPEINVFVCRGCDFWDLLCGDLSRLRKFVTKKKSRAM
jgi:hypothetical protein